MYVYTLLHINICIINVCILVSIEFVLIILKQNIKNASICLKQRKILFYITHTLIDINVHN